MASNRIKGITIEIGGNVTPLNKALGDVDKSLKKTQDELKDVNKLLKLDPGNVELLRQKNNLLTEAIGNTKKRQEELIKALEQLKGTGDTEENRKQQDALQRELIETTKNLENMEKELGEAGGATEDAGKSIDKAEKSASTFADTLKAKLTGEAIIAAVKKLSKGLKDLATGAAQLSDDLQTQAQKTGLSTDALQEYAYMAELVDTDVDTITGSMAKLTKSMASAKGGTGKTAEAFKKLGVRIYTATGELRDNQDVFNDVIDALGGIQNETERDAAAMDLFGKSAQDLNPLILAGSDNLEKYAQEAHDVGYVMDTDMIKKNVEASDAMARMSKAVEGAKNEIGTALAPVIKDAAEGLTGFLQKCRENKDAIETFGKVAAVAAAALIAFKVASTIASALNALKVATESATAAQALLNAVLNANPFVLVATALAGLVAAMVLFGKQQPKMSPRVEAMQAEVNELHDAIQEQADAWDQVKKAQEKAIKQGQSELNYYDDLWGELQKIVDENGKVKKGYEERAKFITGQLSEALGKEIQLTGDQIKDYQKLRGEIENLIKTRRAEIALKAGEDAYMQAIKNRDQATINLTKTGLAYEKAQRQWAAADKRRADAKIAYDAAVKAADGDLTDDAVQNALKRYNAILEENVGIKKQLDNYRTEYEAAKEQSEEYTYAIAQYEQNLAAMHAGEFEKISTVNFETAKSYGSMSAAEKKALDNMYGDLAAQASGLYNESRRAAENILRGATAGLQNKVLRDQANREVASFAGGLTRTMQVALKERSPSRVTEEIGKYFVQGFGVGVEDEEQTAYKDVAAFGQSTIAALQGAVSGGASANLGINSAGANTLVAARPAAGSGGINVSVTVNGNVDDYEQMAAVIGQKLQQQMARQERAFA